MQISDSVKEYLKADGRWNILATSGKTGKTNAAAFGSFQLADDGTILVMFGDNRSFANLKENPHAACFVVLHGKTGMAAEGCRLYLRALSFEETGPRFDEVKARIKARIGNAAEILKHLVKFEIVEVRPLLDFGQGI